MPRPMCSNCALHNAVLDNGLCMWCQPTGKPKSKLTCFLCGIDPEGRIWEVVFVALLVACVAYLR